MDCDSIQICAQIPFNGIENSIEARLKQVRLKGFPNVKIYEKAQISITTIQPSQIPTLFTPQPNVYTTHLERVYNLANIFEFKEIDIFNLKLGVDFLNTKNGEQWTIIPPIVERFTIPRNPDGTMNYEAIIGEKVKQRLHEQGKWLNPELKKVKHPSETDTVDLINDGSHRIEAARRAGKSITCIIIEKMTEGYPYYAAPQNYSNVQIHPTRDKAPESKTHIVEDPAHKDLYRVFPTGGILSGTVRKKE